MTRLKWLSLPSLFFLIAIIVSSCTTHSKPTIQDQEGSFHMDLPDQWTLCSDSTVNSLGKMNNGWVDNLFMSEKNPDRNRIVGCAQDSGQMVQVVVRWTKDWLPRVFVPPGGMSPTGDNVESIPLPSTHDGAVTADNIDQLRPDEQEWFFGILTRRAERDLTTQDQAAKLVSSSHKSLPNGYLMEYVSQFPKSGVMFESKDLMFLPKHDKRILCFSGVLPLSEMTKYQTDIETLESNFNSSIESQGKS